MRLALALGLVFLLGPLSGCIGAYEDYDGFDPDREYKNPGVFPGNYTFPGGVLKAGPYKASDPEIVQLRSTLPAYASPAGENLADGTVLITMAIWRPENVTEPVPVIIDAGPYYEMVGCARSRPDGTCAQWDNGTIDKPDQRTPDALANFLPHGYAVVQLAVRGTGTSGGCMDLMGPSEMHDLDQAITWLGEQPWSNGNVALWGTSYDGSTPWEAAATGNPHVKTIVPISGLPDVYGLMFHNGSAETRGMAMHDRVYWGFGFSPEFLDVDPPAQPPPETPLPRIPGLHPVNGIANGRQQYQDMQNLLCPDVYEGVVLGGWARAVGDRGPEASSYWRERDHRQQVLDNYKGSVFLIHGLQDWNVDPHSAVPFNTQLRAAGLEVKELYGQWDHNVPNGRCLGRSPAWAAPMGCRMDWMEVMLRWFDRYLKGNTTVDTGPWVQMQDDLGYWRNADAFPPAAPQWTELHLSADGALPPAGAIAGEALLQASSPNARGNFVEFRSEALAEDLRFSGLPQLHVPFQPQSEGGQLAFWLFDEDEKGNARAMLPSCSRGRCQVPPATELPPVIGHGQMDLRYHAGGETMQALTPGQTYVAKGEFEPLDAMVPRGHRLSLWVFQGQFPDHAPTATQGAVKLLLGDDAVLRLPVVTVDPEDIFPVPGVPTPSRELYATMHTPKAPYPPTDWQPNDLPPVPINVPPTKPAASTAASLPSASPADPCLLACAARP